MTGSADEIDRRLAGRKAALNTFYLLVNPLFGRALMGARERTGNTARLRVCARSSTAELNRTVARLLSGHRTEEAFNGYIF
jgi:hypothetical protein